MSWSEACGGLLDSESCRALFRDGGVAAGVGDRSSPRGCRPLFVVLKTVSTIPASKSRGRRRRSRRTGVGPGSTCTEHYVTTGASAADEEVGPVVVVKPLAVAARLAVIAVAAPGVVSQPVLASDCHPPPPAARQVGSGHRAHTTLTLMRHEPTPPPPMPPPNTGSYLNTDTHGPSNYNNTRTNHEQAFTIKAHF
ncbi:hypothetical protein TcasGA2_TC004870 [Tribolium castaneum]|uniref:Uncharacterized protein n=1 Tax=Tribolium castaneum TaxID=7070 RepID=D6WBN2_TRICA|nr:hypothetical protein TcasGA2_TC004870 [Tribolium castaneum]